MHRADLDDIDNPTLWTTPHEYTKSKKSAPKKREYLTPLPALAQRIVKRETLRLALDPVPAAAFPGSRHEQARRIGEQIGNDEPRRLRCPRPGYRKDLDEEPERRTTRGRRSARQ
jgi:hypothetical protein